MVHEALQQWRNTNCRGPIGDPAIARFLKNAIASRESTPNNNTNSMDSPFSIVAMALSPLGPLLDLGIKEVVFFDGDAELNELVDSEIPLEIQDIEFDSADYKTSSSSDDDNLPTVKAEDKEGTEDWSERPRRSSRTKTKRASNATSTRSSRRPAKKSTAPVKTMKKKKQTVDEVFEVLPQGESRKCSCKKSRCLKLYCECFAAGVLCDPGCKCSDCSNTADNVTARRKAVAYKLSRKPQAFQEKIVAATAAKDGALHSKGCNCKRSGCQKKYCECYQGGVACNDSCKCVGCKNDGSLMHLRDLGVSGWKAPDGGFKQSAHGLMSTMIVVPEGRDIEEPIPVCETEVALEKFLVEEHARRDAVRALMFPPRTPKTTDASTPKSATVWPVAKPVQEQVTPRSGTRLEPYPTNQKRRCQKKTPTSFSTRDIGEDTIADRWLIELGGDASILSSVEEEVGEALPKGIKFRAQWNDGATPGYYHNDDGKIAWGYKDGAANEQHADIDSVEIDTDIGGDLSAVDDFIFKDVAQHDMDTELDSVHTAVQPQVEDVMMHEVEVAMAELLTPRFGFELPTPRLADLLTPHSCRSNATRSSNMDAEVQHMDAEFDWDQHVSTPRGDWDNLMSTPRAIQAC